MAAVFHNFNYWPLTITQSSQNIRRYTTVIVEMFLYNRTMHLCYGGLFPTLPTI